MIDHFIRTAKVPATDRLMYVALMLGPEFNHDWHNLMISLIEAEGCILGGFAGAERLHLGEAQGFPKFDDRPSWIDLAASHGELR